MKNRETRCFHNLDHQRLTAEYTRDALNLTVTMESIVKREVTIEVLTVQMNPFGLTEREVSLAVRTITLYPAGEHPDRLLGWCTIPGTFYPGWADRLYFRIIDRSVSSK